MSETLTENSADVIAAGKAEDYHTNEKQENLMSREASVLGTGESISGCTEEEIEEACENNINDGDSHFESRTASMSFNSNTTENSFRYVSTDEGKVEENSAPALDYKTDTVAPDELSSEPEQQQNPATQDNPFLQSVKYLEKHQILRLFQVRAKISKSITYIPLS